MVVASLYKISLQKTFSLLPSGIWNSFEENPFSFFPTKIIDDLMHLAYPDAQNMEDIRLLLTSGRIQYLHLLKMNYELRKELDVLLKMLSKDNCKNLRKISVPKSVTSCSVSLLEDVLRMCPNLEDVYSRILFDLNALKDCKKMRCLRFNSDERLEIFNFTSQADFEVLRSLPKLEIFAFSDGYHYCFVDPLAIAKIILKCPNLISVGYVDTITSLAQILETESNHQSTFKLRWCLWGYPEWDIRNLKCLAEYRNLYPEYIKNAVSFYSLVEELELLVFHKDCLQYLSKLQHLTFLCINFYHTRNVDCVPEFISVLEKIGPQLRYLSVQKPGEISLNRVCDQCPNLESLLIMNPIVIASDEPSSCLKHLKKLCCFKANRESLMYLLSNCSDLTTLVINESECVEDGLLANILKKNAFSQLKVVSISKCSLSNEGLRLLLLSVPSIEVLVIGRRQREVMDLIKELNLKTQHYLNTPNDLESVNFFYRKKYWKIV